MIWCRCGVCGEKIGRVATTTHGRVKRTGVLTRCTASSSFRLFTLPLSTFTHFLLEASNFQTWVLDNWTKVGSTVFNFRPFLLAVPIRLWPWKTFRPLTIAHNHQHEPFHIEQINKIWSIVEISSNTGDTPRRPWPAPLVQLLDIHPPLSPLPESNHPSLAPQVHHPNLPNA